MVFGEVGRMDRPKMKIAEFDGESISGLCFHQNYREPLGKSDSSSFSLSTYAPRRPQILEAVANFAPINSMDEASGAQKGRYVALAEST